MAKLDWASDASIPCIPDLSSACARTTSRATAVDDFPQKNVRRMYVGRNQHFFIFTIANSVSEIARPLTGSAHSYIQSF